MYLKCYTAEEIGAEVGLKESQTKEALSPVLEDFLKTAKVTVSVSPIMGLAENKQTATVIDLPIENGNY